MQNESRTPDIDQQAALLTDPARQSAARALPPTQSQQPTGFLPSPPPPDGFITEAELLRRLPVSRRTLGYWRRRKLIPYVKLPSCRRILYDWAGIRAALLRQQIGGAA